jgi:hypothetical protein
MSLFSWIRNRTSTRTHRRRAKHRPPAARFRPQLEALEDRTLPSTFYAATASDLIADINAANKAGGTNTIVLTTPTSSPYALTVANNSTDGPTCLPVISKKDCLTIVGNGDTIDANHDGRLFDVAIGGSLTLQNLTLQNGLAQPAKATGYSADGGAIYNQGTLVLSGVAVQFNTASGSRGNAAGGGIWSNGSLTLENSSLVQGNSAVAGYGGASNAYGGGICIAGGTANITSTQFGGLFANKAEGGTNNYNLVGSAYGGAVCVLAGMVTLSGDTLGGPVGSNGAIDQNMAVAGMAGSSAHGYGFGGGLCVLGGTVTLANDVVENNTAGWFDNWGSFWEYGYGGGLYVAHGATFSIDSYTLTYTFNNTPNGYDINYG